MNFKDIIEKKKTLESWKSFDDIFNKEEMQVFVSGIISMNREGKSFVKIAKELQVGRTNIRKLLAKYGYTAINEQNKLRIRPDLFSKIETEEDAYWLGFIYADGYISDDYKFEVSLNYKDYPHLLKFAKYCDFNADKVVKKQKVGKYFRCRMGFATMKLEQDFSSIGIFPRKSLTLQYPDFLKHELHKHFIRGYFDGDGSIGIRKPRTVNSIRREISATILGTPEFLVGLNTNVQLPEKNIRRRENIFILSFSCREARIFLDFIYGDCTIYLDRKYKIYKEQIAPLYSNI